MKNILISPTLSRSLNGIIYSCDRNWFSFFKYKKVNIVPLGFEKFSKEKILNLKPKGIILPGGNDLYLIKKNNLNLERDIFERKLINISLRYKIPLLGVCKGFQSIANYFNGKIVKCYNHVRSKHILKVNNSRFIKFKKLTVNSFHNYGVEKINKKFKIISKSNDGLIEIAEHNNKKILCMMFHPERSCGSQIKLRRIICDYFKIK